MKTTEDFIREMECAGVMVARKYTFSEYAAELAQFQDVVCKMIAGNKYHEKMRIDEALYIMETTARKKDVRKQPAVHNGILAMKKLSKEMNITMSGAQGENLVFRTLEFLERPNTQIFRNVYVANEQDETELDGIVLTDSGIIILEIKRVKSDFALTEDGRMVFSGDECYEKVPLGEKMALKRRLLKQCLEKTVLDKGLDIPVHVDSYIVFSAPKGQRINIDDRYHKEKYCFRSCLNKKVEHYLGRAYYTEEQLSQLGEILSEIETNVKRFETTLDYDDVRRRLAEAMTVLQGEPESEEETIESLKARIVELEDLRAREERRRKVHKAVGLRYSIASMFAGALISGAALMLGVSLHN